MVKKSTATRIRDHLAAIGELVANVNEPGPPHEWSTDELEAEAWDWLSDPRTHAHWRAENAKVESKRHTTTLRPPGNGFRIFDA